VQNNQGSRIDANPDYKMPVMNATVFLNKIHKHKKLKRIPIVIITGEVGLNKAGMFLDKGVKAFLNKPVNKQDIEKVLRQYVKGMENTEPIESL
jgi:response regulator RpfG family c-di-GMP phosphodiesterase